MLSDALESIVNLAGAMMALAMLTIAEQPADDRHAYGHGKAEYFSSGFEGFLILLAAGAIGVSAVERLIDPQPLSDVGIGLAVSVVASAVNVSVASCVWRSPVPTISVRLLVSSVTARTSTSWPL